MFDANQVMTYLKPEVILAFAPLVEQAVAALLRWIFKSSTSNSLSFAGKGDTRVLIKAVADNPSTQKALVAYIENNASLEKSFEIFVFVTLSLIVWGLSARPACSEQYIFYVYGLFWLALVVMLLIFILNLLPNRRGIDFADEGATNKYYGAALVFNIFVILFLIITKEFLCKHG